MNDRDSNSHRTTLTAQEARQGQIVLNTTSRRVIFFGAFVVIAALAVIAIVIAAGTE